jgi:hypothetical protein
MTQFMLRRVEGDRRRMALDDGAWLRRRSRWSSDVDAGVDGREYRFHRGGLLRPVATAQDSATGEPVLRWQARDRRLVAGGRRLKLRPAPSWHHRRWLLLDGDRRLARFEPRGSWKELRVDLASDAAPDRLLLLFAAWLVDCEAREQDAAAGVTPGPRAARRRAAG